MTAAAFRKFLARHGWTMYRFSKLTGIAQSTVQHWANVGIVRPQDKLLVGMIDHFCHGGLYDNPDEILRQLSCN